MSTKGLENIGNHGITSKCTGRQTAVSFFPMLLWRSVICGVIPVVLGRLFYFCFIGVELIGYIENAISQTTVAFKGVVKAPSNPQTSSNIGRPVSKKHLTDPSHSRVQSTIMFYWFGVNLGFRKTRQSWYNKQIHLSRVNYLVPSDDNYDGLMNSMVQLGSFKIIAQQVPPR